jgi:lycopene beta-cyclase
VVYFLNPLENQYTYIIQGAGASGLWLAYWLDQLGLLETDTLLIVEGVESKGNDRTWCFWTTEPDSHFPFVDTRWTSLRIQGSDKHIEPYQYCHARSDDFYRWMRDQLKKNVNVYWSNDWIENAESHHEKVWVTTTKGNFSAKYFFRSGQSTESKTKPRIDLWQSFVGWRVRLQNGTWDTHSATLMDFSIPQSGVTRFLYVLPISEHEGLIEVTQFHASKLSRDDGESVLKQICSQRNWHVELLEVECDAIPMSMVFNQNETHFNQTERIIPIGLDAGALKPTTGYGFLSMREHGRNIALALKQRNAIPRIYRKRRFRFYDALLLQILEKDPNKGKPIFERLFSRQPVHRILRFLDEKTTIFEEVMIFSRLQVGWFLNALYKHVKR